MFEYLRRNINTSTRYDRYFQKSNCAVEYLGYGTTDLTLKLMKNRTYKYKNQTKKLATKFTNKNLASKTKEIQNFLYHYLQYKADGYEQKLKSPDCAYTDRLNGLDCKSYSLFGGSLLLNKNINFCYRKVKQPNIKPNKYSHVYIVIPKNQKTNNLKDGYYVIDGTKREQSEVQYIKKKDILIMADKFPHYGLNASVSDALKFIQEFNNLLSKLQNKGASPSVLLNFKNAVNYYLSKNKSAEFRRIKGGILVGEIPVTFSNYGLNGAEGEKEDYAWLEDVWSWVQGLNFSCWGSHAVTEERMKGVISFMTTYIIERINVLKSATASTEEKKIALNQYIAIAYNIYNVAEQKRTRGYDSCSDGRIAKVAEAAQQFISKLNSVKITLGFNYTVTKIGNTTNTTNIQQYGNALLNAEFGGDNRTITKPNFNLIKKTITTGQGGGQSGGKEEENNKGEKKNITPLVLGGLAALKLLSII